MAEVLITLGVIGVVAVLTIPTLVAKYDELVTVNKLKKTYSEIVNAIEMGKEELGTSSYAEQFNPAYSVAEQLDGFVKYLNVVERCSASNSKGCGGFYVIKPKTRANDGYGNVRTFKVNGERAVLSDGAMVYLSGKKNWTGDCITTYTKYDTDENGNYTNLVDGKPVPNYYNAQHCAEIFIDINGVNGRNQFGYDAYSLTIAPQKINQHPGYGAIYDTIRTGKLTYEKYSLGKY